MTVKRNGGRLRDAIEVCWDPCRKVRGERSNGESGRYDVAAKDVRYNIHEAVSRPSASPPMSAV